MNDQRGALNLSMQHTVVRRLASQRGDGLYLGMSRLLPVMSRFSKKIYHQIPIKHHQSSERLNCAYTISIARSHDHCAASAAAR